MKDRPIKKNMPTVPEFRIKGSIDFGLEKMRWIRLLAEYKDFPSEGFIHPFFGIISKEQTGFLAYKHADHHLRQFSC